jgi:hypothetical protein
VSVCYCTGITLQAASGDPMVMWLSGLHTPESFLTALVQIASHKNGWPLERSTSYTTVTTYVDADDVDEWPDQVRIYTVLVLILHKHSTALEIDFCRRMCIYIYIYIYIYI